MSPTYSSWAQAGLLSRIAEVVVRTPGDQLPADVQLADQVGVAARLATMPGAAEGAPMQHLLTSFGAYERDLSLLGLDDSQLVAGYSRGRLRLALLWSALKAVLALPFAAIGIVVHVVPFQIMKQVGKKPTNEGIKATVKLLGCFVLFVAVYVVVGVVVGREYGPWAGLVAALAAPLCGYAVVRLRNTCSAWAGSSRAIDGSSKTETCSTRSSRTARPSSWTPAGSCSSRDEGGAAVQTDRAQVAEVWRPTGGDRALPVVVLIHGGFWRQLYTKRLMHRMAKAVMAHGWVAYNIEYRRVGASDTGDGPQRWTMSPTPSKRWRTWRGSITDEWPRSATPPAATWPSGRGRPGRRDDRAPGRCRYGCAPRSLWPASSTSPPPPGAGSGTGR